MAKYNDLSVPVPAENRVINHKTGEVFHVVEKVYIPDRKYNSDRRSVIGYVNSPDETTMTPNANYARYYPEEFRMAAQDILPPVRIRVGAYLMTLAIGQQWGLYDALVQSFGPESANRLMDAAMGCALTGGDPSDADSVMEDQLRFGERPGPEDHEPEPVSREAAAAFLDAWLKACRKRGTDRVWICLENAGREKGRCCLYAADARDGTPVSYVLAPDEQTALGEMLDGLRLHGITAEGILADRQACDEADYRFLTESGLRFAALLPEDSPGFAQMYEMYGARLRQHSVYRAAPYTYAASGLSRAFAGEDEGCVTLIYDSKAGFERAERLNEDVEREAARLNAEAESCPEPDAALTSFLCCITADDTVRYEADHEALDAAKAAEGYSAAAGSRDLSAREIVTLMHLRDRMEEMTPWPDFRSQEEEESRVLASFAARVVKTRFSRLCETLGYDPVRMSREMIQLSLVRYEGYRYEALHHVSGSQIRLMNEVGFDASDLSLIVDQETGRARSGAPGLMQSLPLRDLFPADSEEAPPCGEKAPEEPPAPRKRGRPKGVPNRPKEVLEAERARRASMPKRGPGRPRGSKNRKKEPDGRPETESTAP